MPLHQTARIEFITDRDLTDHEIEEALCIGFGKLFEGNQIIYSGSIQVDSDDATKVE